MKAYQDMVNKDFITQEEANRTIAYIETLQTIGGKSK